MLSPRASAEAGKWRTSRTPYLKAIMDCLSSSHPAQVISFMKGAQVGGPLHIDTPIPTVHGWTTMGDIRLGDQVFDENGFPCSVIGTSLIFKNRDCYEIVFSDGSVILCDSSHLWTVWDEKKYENRKVKTITTDEIKGTYKVRNVRNRYAIDVVKPLQIPDISLPLDPYLLGYWLGNGSATMNHITAHEDDSELIKYLSDCGIKVEWRLPPWRKGKAANILIDGGRIRRRKSNGRFSDTIVDANETYFMGQLRSLNLIKNKHIPPAYLRAGFYQRLALLQGLMDSDGCIDVRGRCEFSNKNKKLIDDVYELLMTLGLKCTVFSRQKKIQQILGRECRVSPSWRLSFLAYSDLPVFRLTRKKTRQAGREGRRTSETERRRIVDVRKVNSVPVRCISVNSRNNLFLAGRSMIPTHNTEAGSNWIGYVIDHAPGPMMAVQPTVDMAKRNSKQRIQPLIEESPKLSLKVKSPRERDAGNTILVKEFPGGILVMTGANSAVGLRSLPARYLFLDEIDAYPGDVDGEGDPIALAEARARTFARRKIFKVSTPTIQGRSRIESAYEASNQMKYEVPCPYCGHYQDLIWKQLRWPDGRPQEAAYYCINCEKKIEEHFKTEMLDKGEWVARNLDPVNPRHYGFHLNSLYSPLGWFSWADAAELFEEAKKFPQKLRGFINTVLGETWKEKGEAPNWHRLYERREHYTLNNVPAQGLILTAGVDVQKDRLEVEVVAWGRGKQSWSIDYRVIPGHTNEDYCWVTLFEMLNETFSHASGAALTIRMMAIDSGFNTQEVYNRIRHHPVNRVMAIKGSDVQQSAVGLPKAVDVDWRGKKLRRNVKVWPVGSSVLKTELYGWLNLNAPTKDDEPYLPGYCHFPQYGEQYFKMLTAEQLMVRILKNGGRKYEWEKIYERNEALDCRIYARAAAAVIGIDRFTPDYWNSLEWNLTSKPIETRKEPVQSGASEIVRKKRENSFWS